REDVVRGGVVQELRGKGEVVQGGVHGVGGDVVREKGEMEVVGEGRVGKVMVGGGKLVKMVV
uniref:hypothetical protein n=1 Tax=Kocuria rhizophila TaxID=72000 RepID=UPI001C92F47A